MAQQQLTVHPNVKIVQRMYECFAQGDMNSLKADVFAPDLVWKLPGHHPLGGVKQGPDEVIAFFRQLLEAGIVVDLISVIGTDDYVVEVHRGHSDTGEVKLDTLNCTVYQIRAQRISEVQVYLSDQYGADAFFWAGYRLKPIPERLA
ncbi:MAG: hypothetical protein JWM18_782 [Chloroflexi bacterium]|jgi:ketosteroid isomerase-like protein|nr:hypothetical protein [Chloroflexota bacterium]